MDQIILRDLAVECIVGTEERERHTPQKITFDVTLDLDLGRASRSDDLGDSVNYVEIVDRIRIVAQEGRFFLLERLAGAVLKCCLEFPGIRAAAVTAVKHPASLKDVGAVAVKLAERNS